MSVDTSGFNCAGYPDRHSDVSFLRGPIYSIVQPTADGRLNGAAGEPCWLRPPAAAEPAGGADGPAGHGSPAAPLATSKSAMRHPVIHNRRLGPVTHRVVNAVFGGCQLAGLGAVGLGFFSADSWLWSASLGVIYLAPALSVLLLLVGPEKHSFVNGVAGEVGNDELK